mmetsp:Transcript_9952/g.23968  ORF Transcript_9952/g.23968 Transcript_9952/m.23968 type:complete len:244 (-) Transcript_9952:82-813(-)
MGRIDDSLPLVCGNIRILVDNGPRSMAATLLDLTELERRRGAVAATTRAGGRPPTVQYCGTCRDLRHGRGGCQAGACAGGCVKVCARCLHAYHDTRICSECPAAETGKCSSHVCLHPGTRAAHVRASAGCDACPPGSGCSAVPQPPADTPTGSDADAVMADAGPTDVVGDGAVAGHDIADDGHGGDLVGNNLTGAEDRGDIVDSSSDDDDDNDDDWVPGPDAPNLDDREFQDDSDSDDCQPEP